MYKVIKKKAGLARVYYFDEEESISFLVLELLGPSLEDLFNYCGRKFSLKTVLLIADQALARLWHIHNCGVLHRDVKPGNFLMGRGRQGNTLYLIDFGISTSEHRVGPRQRHTYLDRAGTTMYRTVAGHEELGEYKNTHWPTVGSGLRFDCIFGDKQGGLLMLQTEQWFGDELEMLGYMLLYFARGSLPWEELKGETEEEREELMKNAKMEVDGKALCDGFLPEEFATLIDDARALPFGVKPRYAHYRELFRRRMRMEGFKYDNVFDWTIKRFNELYGDPSNGPAAPAEEVASTAQPGTAQQPRPRAKQRPKRQPKEQPKQQPKRKAKRSAKK